MISEMRLSPEELYFLFNECEGNMIDYDYIAMMKDVQLRESVIREEIIASLEEKNVIEDVWGEVFVNEDVRMFLSPIWNGDFESQIITLRTDEKDDLIQERMVIHREETEYRMVLVKDNAFQVTSISADDIDVILNELMPESYQKFEEDNDLLLNSEKPDSSFVLRNIYMDGSLAVFEQFYTIDDKICRMTSENTYAFVSKEEFLDTANTVVKGE